MLLTLLIDASTTDYTPVIIQIVVTAGVIFGGTGFWQWKQEKDRAKREAANKEQSIGPKVDTLTTTINELSTKVDSISSGMQDIKNDILILQKANEETIKYRELRDKHDKESARVQKAAIQSLTAILRERLLDNYHHCMKKGYYTKEEREVYGEMFECYTQDPFNGNGVMHDLQPIMKSLPWTQDEAKTSEHK